MADNRNHDHYVFQDLDLLGNKIKNVRNVSSDDDLTLAAKSDSDKKVIVESLSSFQKKLTVTAGGLEVTGNSTFNDNVTIGNEKTLTISGVRIQWNNTTKSLEFINTNA